MLVTFKVIGIQVFSIITIDYWIGRRNAFSKFFALDGLSVFNLQLSMLCWLEKFKNLKQNLAIGTHSKRLDNETKRNKKNRKIIDYRKGFCLHCSAPRVCFNSNVQDGVASAPFCSVSGWLAGWMVLCATVEDNETIPECVVCVLCVCTNCLCMRESVFCVCSQYARARCSNTLLTAGKCVYTYGLCMSDACYPSTANDCLHMCRQCITNVWFFL